MLYIERNKNKKIIGLKTTGKEVLDPQHSEHLDFLRAQGLRLITDSAGTDTFTISDLKFIRVLEDVVEVLVQKGVMTWTDLPPAAIEKLQNRSVMREQTESLQGLMGEE